MDLKEALIQYKDCTINLIQFADKEHYDYIEKALEDRQKIIDDINILEYTKEEFKEIAIELQLNELEKQLTAIMAEKRDKLKEKMLQLKKSQSATNAYNFNKVNVNIFNKKI